MKRQLNDEITRRRRTKTPHSDYVTAYFYKTRVLFCIELKRIGGTRFTEGGVVPLKRSQ